MEIKKHIIGTKDIETIQTRENSKILGVRIENDRSLPEIFLLEDENSNEIQKNFLIAQEGFRILYDFDELEFIGSYSIRNNLHIFWVFEIKSEYIKRIGTPIKLIEDIEISITQPIIQTTIKKWTRLPKPDLNKSFTKDELEEMHPERQLKYILIKKYNLKGRLANKLSVENQIKYILSTQNGDDCDVIELIETQNFSKKTEKFSKILNENSLLVSQNIEDITLVFHSIQDPQLI
jgi:hypothetical protein